MGIKGAPCITKQWKLSKLHFNPGTVYMVDVLSVFYGLFMKSPEPKIFWDSVLKLFPSHPSVIFVFDGHPNQEKTNHIGMQRKESKRKSILKVRDLMTKWKDVETLKKSHHKKLDSSLKNTFVFTSRMKNDLVEEGRLRGLNVVVAPSEADLTIPKMTSTINTTSVVVITKDTDFLFHQGVHKIFLVKNRWLVGRYLDVKTFASVLDLEPADLPRLGAISGCDYAPNVKGVGIKGCSKSKICCYPTHF